MQKAHLCEAILSVIRGVDETVHGLERLKPASDPQLDEEPVLSEDHRARRNSYFCSALQGPELRDSARLQSRYLDTRNTLDELRVYRDVQVVEDRWCFEGKPPKVRFFTQEEQREWERQYQRPLGDVPRSEGEAS